MTNSKYGRPIQTAATAIGAKTNVEKMRVSINL